MAKQSHDRLKNHGDAETYVKVHKATWFCSKEDNHRLRNKALGHQKWLHLLYNFVWFSKTSTTNVSTLKSYFFYINFNFIIFINTRSRFKGAFGKKKENRPPQKITIIPIETLPVIYNINWNKILKRVALAVN